MATPNYSYEKRQKELAKKRKKEDKLKRKGEDKPDDELGEDGVPGSDTARDTQQTGMPPAESAT
ncbi:MAG: hypothetical protein JWP96_2811 [Polaromonas sp.]|nr:hypothetical protein [Polaromonas sp.]